MASAAELRALARVERDPRKRARPLAIADARDGMAVAAAALGDRPRPGRRRKLDAGRRAQVEAWALAGPAVERDGVAAWRGGDARAMVEQRFAVQLAPSSAHRLLGELHLSALVPRPRPSEADPAAQAAAFQQTSRPG